MYNLVRTYGRTDLSVDVYEALHLSPAAVGALQRCAPKPQGSSVSQLFIYKYNMQNTNAVFLGVNCFTDLYIFISSVCKNTCFCYFRHWLNTNQHRCFVSAFVYNSWGHNKL